MTEELEKEFIKLIYPDDFGNDCVPIGLARVLVRMADAKIAKLEAELALARKWRPMVYEDELPEDMSEELYDAWFQFSRVIDGIRMGPTLPPPKDAP